MNRRFAFLGLHALALACWLCLPAGTVQAHGGGGHGGGGHGGGGHGGFGHGGFGHGGFGHGGFGHGGFGHGHGGFYGGGLGGFGYGLGGFGYGLGGYGLYGLGYGGYGYGYGGYPGWGYGYSQPYYYSTPYYSTPYYSTPYYSGAVPSTDYQSLYPAVDTTHAYIRVHVPADAQVLFNNSPTTEQGPERLFISPPLEPYAKGYTYQISARWTQNGKQEHADRTVRVMPGETTDVNFLNNAPEPTPQPSPQKTR